MKISEMTREQLRDYMKSSREIHVFDADAKSWQRAFQLAKLAGHTHLEMDCTKCIQKVMDFLNES